MLKEILVIGLLATALIDGWAWVRRWLFSTPLPDYASIGRWLLWMARGRFVHRPISATRSLPAEAPVGWWAHYCLGLLFAALFVAIVGAAWLADPQPWPALAFGLATVSVPWLVMQPALGVGLAARRAPRPWRVRGQNLLTHLLFGAGLYFAALVI